MRTWSTPSATSQKRADQAKVRRPTDADRARTIAIDDPGDPRIAVYLNIREHDLVGREGLFVAEGEVVLRVLLGWSPHEAASVLIAEKRLSALRELLAMVPPEVPIYTVNQTVMDRIVGFPMHRGVLAIGRRTALPSATNLLDGLGPRAVVVGLFGIANHDNMGGIFRNAAGLGADAILLDRDCCDPLYRKAIRVSVGASLIVPFARFDSGDDALALLRSRGFEPIALSPAGETTLSELERPDRAAVLFGAEGPGLASHLMERARTVSIPMARGFDSLNVATVSGIVLHHLNRRATEVS